MPRVIVSSFLWSLPHHCVLWKPVSLKRWSGLDVRFWQPTVKRDKHFKLPLFWRVSISHCIPRKPSRSVLLLSTVHASVLAAVLNRPLITYTGWTHFTPLKLVVGVGHYRFFIMCFIYIDVIVSVVIYREVTEEKISRTNYIHELT